MKKWLHNETDIQRCIAFQRKVKVWIQGELETIGLIEKTSEYAVKVNGHYYLKANFKFMMLKVIRFETNRASGHIVE